MGAAARRIAFFGLALFLLLGPIQYQILGGTSRFYPRWRMFADMALHLVEVRFEAASAGGERQPVDRLALLGYGPTKRAPAQVRLLKSHRALRAQYRQMCRAIGPEAVLHVKARAAARYGWRQTEDGVRNVCDDMPRRGRPALRKSRKRRL